MKLPTLSHTHFDANNFANRFPKVQGANLGLINCQQRMLIGLNLAELHEAARNPDTNYLYYSSAYFIKNLII